MKVKLGQRGVFADGRSFTLYRFPKAVDTDVRFGWRRVNAVATNDFSTLSRSVDLKRTRLNPLLAGSKVGLDAEKRKRMDGFRVHSISTS